MARIRPARCLRLILYAVTLVLLLPTVYDNFGIADKRLPQVDFIDINGKEVPQVDAGVRLVVIPSAAPNQNFLRIEKDIKLNESHLNPSDNENGFYSALLGHADENGFLMIAYVEFGYIEVAINLYISSIQRYQIVNYIFISTDNKSCDILQERNINCVVTTYKLNDTGTPSNYGTENFNLKTHFKTKIVFDILKMNFTVLLTDLDIVFLQNPVPILINESENTDLVIQKHGQPSPAPANTGFYLVRPTTQAIQLFEKSWQIGTSRIGKKRNDQDVMVHVLKNSRANVQLKVKYLPEKQFPTGNKYWDINKIMFLYEDPWNKPAQVIVHNNWVVTKAAKIYRFKESQMWKYDLDSYYSDSSAKYIVYDNPYDGNATTVNNLEESALISALSIGYILNRKVILPAFHCYGCKHKACHTSDNKCSLMAHYKIARFDKFFGNEYKEHVFLNNSMTPIAIKQSVSQTMFINSTFLDSIRNEHRNIRKMSKSFQPKNSTSGASVSEIQNWFGDCEQSVLKFHSLYNAFEGFPHETQYSKIIERLNNALMHSTYLQK